MYQTIIFDLDGTLTDPSVGIINSISYALDKMSLLLPEEEELLSFIGPPLQESFSKFFHLSANDCQKAIGYYREYFSQKGIFENMLYPEVIEVLTELKASGKQLLVATSKPELFAIQILEHFSLSDFFDCIAGASMDSSRNKKADVITRALEMAQISDSGTCIMIGDRKHDILGAQAHQMDAVGVLYGFGSRTELENTGATYIINQLEELPKLIQI